MFDLLNPVKCVICAFTFLLSLFSIGKTAAQDTCTINDDCLTAIEITGVVTDQSFVCIDGCNLYSAPDTMVSNCLMGDFPTVWYVFHNGSAGTLINIEVNSSEFESPAISLFRAHPGCDQLEQVFLMNGNLTCVIGLDGKAKATGTTIFPNATYYIAVSSFLSIGGDFEICISTISNGSFCVVDRDFEVTARSNGGSLEGPFDPGEKISICMNINSYTANGNGCQWFQGIVPVFGNGWDPSSFDSTGQPFNAQLNNFPMTNIGNGLYGATQFSWFDNVGYHHTNPRYQIGDFDNNGRLDMCNSSYEMDCPQLGGITGGCCGPCWETQGALLPGGWFAYGINGTCPDPGPPIAVDWGDGNTCGCCMGPWHFCFDVITRGTPDCLGDSTKRDLTLGFYTFADGEIGAWVGDASVCALDQPLKVSLKALCGRISRRATEILPNVPTGTMFSYQIEDENISHWEWNISPIAATSYYINNGQNGFQIQTVLYNTGVEPIHVQGTFIGYVAGSNDVVLKKIEFDILPQTTGTEDISEKNQMKVYPLPTRNMIHIEWKVSHEPFENLHIMDMNGKLVYQSLISDLEKSNGRMSLSVRDLADGIYFINLGSANRQLRAKLVKI